MLNDISKRSFVFYYPIVLTVIGVFIHLFGVFKLFQLEVPQRIHAIMLVVDFLVVVGLLKKTAWGYWLAVLLYIQQSIMQPIWAYEAYSNGLGLFQLVVVSPLVLAALIALIIRGKEYA